MFGVPVRRVAAFEEPVRNLGDGRGYIDLFWKGVLLVEQKSAGKDLNKAGPRPIDFVISLSADGLLNAAPIACFNAIANKPPLVIFSPTYQGAERPG